MMKKNWIMLLFVVIILFAGSFSAYAFGEKGMGRPGKPEKMIERISKELGLTSEQKEKLLSKAKKNREETKQVLEKNKQFFNKIKDELSKDSPNKDTIHNYIKQINQNELVIQLKRMDEMIDMRQQLTGEQKTKLEILMKKHENGRRKRFNKF